VPVFAGSVPGPLSHVRVCPFDGVAQRNVTDPAGTVTGVGLKKSLPIVMSVADPPPPPLPLPPPPPPPYGEVELSHPTSVRAAAVTIQDMCRMVISE
jgi:hypothetical protein